MAEPMDPLLAWHTGASWNVLVGACMAGLCTSSMCLRLLCLAFWDRLLLAFHSCTAALPSHIEGCKRSSGVCAISQCDTANCGAEHMRRPQKTCCLLCWPWCDMCTSWRMARMVRPSLRWPATSGFLMPSCALCSCLQLVHLTSQQSASWCTPAPFSSSCCMMLSRASADVIWGPYPAASFSTHHLSGLQVACVGWASGDGTVHALTHNCMQVQPADQVVAAPRLGVAGSAPAQARP